MARTRIFISFDYDYDARAKDLLVGQSRHPQSPFEVADWSIKAATNNWKAEARTRIRAADVVVVLCGTQTHRATGVATELQIAQEEGVPYFLLAIYADQEFTKPKTAKAADKVYIWTWDNLEQLIGGSR